MPHGSVLRGGLNELRLVVVVPELQQDLLVSLLDGFSCRGCAPLFPRTSVIARKAAIALLNKLIQVHKVLMYFDLLFVFSTLLLLLRQLLHSELEFLVLQYLLVAMVEGLRVVCFRVVRDALLPFDRIGPVTFKLVPDLGFRYFVQKGDS